MSAAVAPRSPRAPRPAKLAVALAFSLAFVWELLGAVSNLLAWMQFAALARAQLSAFAWSVLLAGLLVPILAFAVALVVARQRGPGTTALVLLTSFCVSQALTLSVLAIFEAGISTQR